MSVPPQKSWSELAAGIDHVGREPDLPLTFRLEARDGEWVVHTAVKPTEGMEVEFDSVAGVQARRRTYAHAIGLQERHAAWAKWQCECGKHDMTLSEAVAHLEKMAELHAFPPR
jgi:hypothetical protein